MNRPEQHRRWTGRRKRVAAARMNRPQSSTGADAATLTDLVYELLDAHQDTADLVAGTASDLAWEAHVEYLRALQRTGREMLAHAIVEAQSE